MEAPMWHWLMIKSPINNKTDIYVTKPLLKLIEKILFNTYLEYSIAFLFWLSFLSFPGGGPPKILDRGVPPRFLNPDPI